MKIIAKWIWRQQDKYNLYNQTVIFRRKFNIDQALTEAKLAITADSFYRLYINDQWVNDGPARGYPEHYKYDLLDVSSYLQAGDNEIRVIARYLGCGTFHQICRQEGFLAQLELGFADGTHNALITDSNWEVSPAPQWPVAVPRIYCQMGGVEFYDARLESEIKFSPAAELFSTDNAPWQGLMPRDCQLLTRKKISINKFVQADVIQMTGIELSIPTQRLLYPGLIDSNNNVSLASGIALIINNISRDKLRISSDNYKISINGKTGNDGWFELLPGRNFMLALNTSMFSHVPEKNLFIEQSDGIELLNPLDNSIHYPCFLRFPELLRIDSDQLSRQFKPELGTLQRQINEHYENLFNEVISETTFFEHLKKSAELIPPECVLPSDFYLPWTNQKIVSDAKILIDDSENLIYDNLTFTVVHPTPDGDIQLTYDLGEQNIGYYDFELNAEKNTVIDIFEVEHIFRNGKPQHTYGYRNGMRYICKSGNNRFTSLKRRSGRYLLIVFRNLTTPVKIRHFQLIESTYPVEYKGSFRSSDDFLNRLWEISVRTLKLCMEDTFTDCPLYEQTLWVGDARNEALFAYPVFGAWDLSKRCIRLPAESLEHLPLAGCQVPSCWDALIPVWSFLWVISIWDYYFETGDNEFIREMWLPMSKNLTEAERRIEQETGLFSSPTWNLFDWSGSDISHRIVIHNTMFFIGALRAAEQCAEIIGEEQEKTRWQNLRLRLTDAVNNYWNCEKSAWPDALTDDNKSPVSTVSIHNCFLSILYDIADDRNRDNAERNTLSPPQNMIKVGSPFAMQYLYETFEKMDMPERIIESFYTSYRPMLEEGATTVWEVFAGSLPPYELTRSHCHAWSSSPVYFLSRLVLGIKMLEAGAGAFSISPLVDRLDWAEGARATIHGPVNVFWKKDNDVLKITASAPQGVKLHYAPNRTHDKLRVIFNGQQITRK